MRVDVRNLGDKKNKVHNRKKREKKSGLLEQIFTESLKYEGLMKNVGSYLDFISAEFELTSYFHSFVSLKKINEE